MTGRAKPEHNISQDCARGEKWSQKSNYKPLRRRQEIRLLELKPAKHPSESIEGILRHTDREGSKYAALSYVCGNPRVERGEPIKLRYRRSLAGFVTSQPLNDFSLACGHNLAEALKRLRHLGITTVWADALCIAQGDDDERTQQVAMMAELYAGASEVHAWLGPQFGEKPETIHTVEEAFAFGEKVWELAQQCRGGHGLRVEEQWTQICFSVAKPCSANRRKDQTDVEKAWNDLSYELQSTVRADEAFPDFLRSMTALSRVQYFARVWTIQETGRARNLTFHYGRRSLPCKAFFLVLCLANSLHEAHGSQYPTLLKDQFDLRFFSMLNARKTIRDESSIGEVLEAVYFERPARGCNDPKDQIFARLGLANDCRGVTLNYNRPVHEVYTEAMQCLLQRGFMDALLSFKPYYSSLDVPWDDMPSWVYDWSAKGLDPFLEFAASGTAKQQVSFKTVGNRHALVMNGMRIGYVQRAMSKFSSCALVAKISKPAIQTADFTADSGLVKGPDKQALISAILDVYDQIGLVATDAIIASLDKEYSLPVIKYWLWWIQWITELWEADTGRFPEDVSHEKVSKAAFELMLRVAPKGVNGTHLLNAMGVNQELSSLLNLEVWLKSILDQDGTIDEDRGPALTNLGIGFMKAIFESAWGMRAISLDAGYVGYALEPAEEGDEVVIFFGVKAPLVVGVRRCLDGVSRLRIIGPAHISGIMYGEAMGKPEFLSQCYTIF